MDSNPEPQKITQATENKTVISKYEIFSKSQTAQNPAQIFKNFPELVKIIDCWERLPEPNRKAIIELAGLSEPETTKP